MKMLDKTEQSDRAPNPNEKPENCYCSALPKGSGLCLTLLYAMAGRQEKFAKRLFAVACRLAEQSRFMSTRVRLRPFTSVVQKIALTAIVDQAHNSN
jgi:hypothetical protein